MQTDRTGRPRLDRDGAPRMVEKPTARLHDLRHSFASLLVSEGQSLPVIGALLGHTQSQTTQRYARLFETTMRDAAGLVDRQVLARDD